MTIDLFSLTLIVKSVWINVTIIIFDNDEEQEFHEPFENDPNRSDWCLVMM